MLPKWRLPSALFSSVGNVSTRTDYAHCSKPSEENRVGGLLLKKNSPFFFQCVVEIFCLFSGISALGDSWRIILCR